MVAGRITDALVGYLEAEDWPVEQVEDTLFRTGFAGDSGRWVCLAVTNDVDDQVAFYSLCPVEVPADRRSAMAEALTRANYGLIVGNFEMDLSDGEIRFKTSIDASDTDLTLPLVRNLVQINVLTMDDYLPALQAVARGADPSTAIRAVEGDDLDLEEGRDSDGA